MQQWCNTHRNYHAEGAAAASCALAPLAGTAYRGPAVAPREAALTVDLAAVGQALERAEARLADLEESIGTPARVRTRCALAQLADALRELRAAAGIPRA